MCLLCRVARVNWNYLTKQITKTDSKFVLNAKIYFCMVFGNSWFVRTTCFVFDCFSITYFQVNLIICSQTYFLLDFSVFLRFLDSICGFLQNMCSVSNTFSNTITQYAIKVSNICSKNTVNLGLISLSNIYNYSIFNTRLTSTKAIQMLF